MNSFSPNMLKTFENCPLKYDLKFIRKINLPQNPILFEKGKKIHALANYYHKGQNITKLESTLSENEKQVWEQLKNNKYFSMKCLHSEYQITAKIDDVWIFGRLDAIMEENENYYILDYKTGKIPQNPEKDFQTMIYLICADKILSNKKSLSFVYIDLKNNENKIIEFSQQLKNIYLKTLKTQTQNILATKNFEDKKNIQHCKYCEYNKLCNH